MYKPWFTRLTSAYQNRAQRYYKYCFYDLVYFAKKKISLDSPIDQCPIWNVRMCLRLFAPHGLCDGDLLVLWVRR